jgi:hypothetical protein
MIPADQVGEVQPSQGGNPTGGIGAFKRLAIEAAQRCVAKEVKAVGNAWKKHAKAGTVEDFVAWADRFYAGHSEFLRLSMRTVFDEWAQAAGGIDQPSAEAILSALCNVDGTLSSLKQVVATNPAGVPQFLSDLNDTFATSLVADIETNLTRIESCK